MIWRKVDSRGRLPLGKDAMRALGLKAGEEVEVVPNGDGTVTLRKAKESDDGNKTIPWDADMIPDWVRDWDRDAIRPTGGWGAASNAAIEKRRREK